MKGKKSDNEWKKLHWYAHQPMNDYAEKAAARTSATAAAATIMVKKRKKQAKTEHTGLYLWSICVRFNVNPVRVSECVQAIL